MLQPSFFEHLEDRLNLAIYDLNEEWRQVKFKITEPTFFFQKNRKPGEVLESPVGPYKYHVDGGLKRTPQFEELQNPFNESKPMSLSAIERLKAKALEAKHVAPDAIKKFEADLDSIIAQKDEIESKRVASVSPHQEAIAGVKGELDGLKSAMDILTNE